MKLTGQRCQCTKCEKVFKSEFGFNKHRAGQHGVNRHCLSTEEMLARGDGSER